MADPAVANANTLAWNGALWIGTDNGLYAWDGDADTADAVSGCSVTSLGVGPGSSYVTAKSCGWCPGTPDDDQSAGYASTS